MRHQVGLRKLGRPTDARLALLRGLCTDLIRHEKLTTTEARAKSLRPLAEQLITLGKRGDLHARRQALAKLYDPKLVDKLFHELGPRFADRRGGYCRIIKLGVRKGDAALVVQISLVE
ncbi:MAG: 50S ribosomal protein L17 [Chloroflexi bacterium]|nr:50S ribosomal protein L17 [Chloroflexota bacterium]